MDPTVPEQITENVPPQDRLHLKRRIDSEYDTARQLLAAKRYKEALKKFKWVFSQEPAPSFFLSSREIRQLIDGYPPSATVIKRWRNDKEKLIMAQRVDLHLLQQWNTLNSCLGEKNRTRDVFLKLKSIDADQEILHDLLDELWQSFVRSKNYHVLKSYLPSLGFRLLLNATEHDSITLFPTQRRMTKATQRRQLDRLVTYMLNEGTMIYEVALALKENRVALEFAKKILAVETSDRTYAGLIKAAIRAKSYEEAITLFHQAKSIYSIRNLKHSSKSIKALPKSHLTHL